MGHNIKIKRTNRRPRANLTGTYKCSFCPVDPGVLFHTVGGQYFASKVDRWSRKTLPGLWASAARGAYRASPLHCGKLCVRQVRACKNFVTMETIRRVYLPKICGGFHRPGCWGASVRRVRACKTFVLSDTIWRVHLLSTIVGRRGSLVPR